MRREDNCRYCGKVMHGPGDPFSPDGYHEEVGDAEHCIRCGSTAYGEGCVFSNYNENPRGIHIHGHGKDSSGNTRCIYCGKHMTSNMDGCVFSPNGRHKF